MERCVLNSWIGVRFLFQQMGQAKQGNRGDQRKDGRGQEIRVIFRQKKRRKDVYSCNNKFLVIGIYTDMIPMFASFFFPFFSLPPLYFVFQRWVVVYQK